MISIMGNFEVCLQHYLFILNAESECLRGDNLWNLGSSIAGSGVNESSGLRMLGMQGFARVSSERRHLSSISRHTNSTNSSCCREIHPQTISEQIHLEKFEKYSFRIWEIQFTEPGSTSTGLTAASATVLLSGEFLVKVEVLQKIDP